MDKAVNGSERLERNNFLKFFSFFLIILFCSPGFAGSSAKLTEWLFARVTGQCSSTDFQWYSLSLAASADCYCDSGDCSLYCLIDDAMMLRRGDLIELPSIHNTWAIDSPGNSGANASRNSWRNLFSSAHHLARQL